MTESKLNNKVIVVSGGTKGVGRAAAEEFARLGAKVVIGGRDKESGLKSVRLMQTYGSEGAFVPLTPPFFSSPPLLLPASSSSFSPPPPSSSTDSLALRSLASVPMPLMSSVGNPSHAL